MIYIFLYKVVDLEDDEHQITDHPYPFGALISALTFLLAFRANFSYNRYWEAVTAIHQMHSKWLDVGMDLAAFHLQSARYQNKRPPAFGEHPELTDLNRFRERENETTLQELEEQLNSTLEPTSHSLRSRVKQSLFRRRRRKQQQQQQKDDSTSNQQPVMALQKPKRKRYKSISRATTAPKTTSATFTSVFASVFSMGGNKKASPAALVKVSSASNLVVRTDSARHFDQAWEHGRPPLFLQEGAHLLSLLSAVGAFIFLNSWRVLG